VGQDALYIRMMRLKFVYHRFPQETNCKKATQSQGKWHEKFDCSRCQQNTDTSDAAVSNLRERSDPAMRSSASESKIENRRVDDPVTDAALEAPCVAIETISL
jgi:hypothetical protein